MKKTNASINISWPAVPFSSILLEAHAFNYYTPFALYIAVFCLVLISHLSLLSSSPAPFCINGGFRVFLLSACPSLNHSETCDCKHLRDQLSWLLCIVKNKTHMFKTFVCFIPFHCLLLVKITRFEKFRGVSEDLFPNSRFSEEHYRN